MIKIIKRYTVVSALIIMCFISAFVALFNGVESTLASARHIKEQIDFRYMHEIAAIIHQPISAYEMETLVADIDNCNVFISGLPMYFEETDGIFIPKIIAKQNEQLSIPTQYAVKSLPDCSVIASTSMVGNYKSLTVNGFEYDIHLTLDDSRYPFLAGTVYVSAVDYFAAFPDSLDELTQVSITLASNKNDLYEAFVAVQNKLAKIRPSSSINIVANDSSESILSSVVSYETVFSIGLFGFALLNTVVISYYWVVVRRREIAIRKAFGYTNKSIIALLAGELAKLIGFAAGICIVVQLLVSGSKMIGLIAFSYLVLSCCFIIAIGVAVIVSMIVPARYIMSIKPSEGVKA